MKKFARPTGSERDTRESSAARRRLLWQIPDQVATSVRDLITNSKKMEIQAPLLVQLGRFVASAVAQKHIKTESHFISRLHLLRKIPTNYDDFITLIREYENELLTEGKFGDLYDFVPWERYQILVSLPCERPGPYELESDWIWPQCIFAIPGAFSIRSHIAKNQRR